MVTREPLEDLLVVHHSEVQDRFLAGGTKTTVSLGCHPVPVFGTGGRYSYLQIFCHTAGFANKMRLTGGLHNSTPGVRNRTVHFSGKLQLIDY